MQQDIKNLNVQALKALAYELILEIDKAQVNLRILQQEIIKRQEAQNGASKEQDTI